ncbi:MAG TPA: hypothetical protein VLE19_08270 [Pyrinomonadaceae bacterium]|nr:hypothetical protein [Pyrinomonadaceae bacterium]
MIEPVVRVEFNSQRGHFGSGEMNNVLTYSILAGIAIVIVFVIFKQLYAGPSRLSLSCLPWPLWQEAHSGGSAIQTNELRTNWSRIQAIEQAPAGGNVVGG